ncbi:hypothetical protein [Streptomyces sp. NPDC057199]|uniref:hypothetical protein n=1 Tax=Streptomyces sp. NPDC057199 TaxID=3346047 RepID=UPI0036366D6F
MLIKPDPTTPEGEAVLDLAELMDGLQESTGEWPGADTVDILGGWLSRFTFAVSETLTSQVTGRAWVLNQWDQHGDEVTLWSDEASALASLAQEVRSSWDDVAGTDGVPYRPPADDRTAADLYYGAQEDLEGYSLHPASISRCMRTPRSLSLSDDEACAEANSTAVFHPMKDPDDEGLPCIEIAGILMFAHLDHELGAVRVAIHLDSASDRLVRQDGTVPLRVQVEDTVVLDDSGEEGAPLAPLLAELLDAADEGQRVAIREAALAAGVLWRCPVCGWDNPGAATCCEGPGPCRKPQPAAEQTSV